MRPKKSMKLKLSTVSLIMKEEIKEAQFIMVDEERVQERGLRRFFRNLFRRNNARSATNVV
jgi:hypothetical protein